MSSDCCTATCCIDGINCDTVIAAKQNSLVRQICASTAGSITSILALNPITVIKVRLQNANTGTYNAEPFPIRRVVSNVLAERGVWGFWAGTRMGIFMSAPNTVLYMSVYEELKLKFAEEPRLAKIRAVTPALAGALARMVSVTIISPLELIRTVQTGGVNQSIAEIARSVVRDEGIRGLYRGWGSSVLRDCPFSGIYWLGFETLRPVYGKLIYSAPPSSKQANFARDGYPALITFLSGATSGMIAAICTHPFDVLKTKQQVAAWHANSANNTVLNNSSSGSSSGSTPTTNITNASVSTQPTKFTLGSVYRAGGVSALFRGLSMRLATVIPASAIMITIYEAIKKVDL
eukprot:gene11827-13724_t